MQKWTNLIPIGICLIGGCILVFTSRISIPKGWETSPATFTFVREWCRTITGTVIAMTGVILFMMWFNNKDK